LTVRMAPFLKALSSLLRDTSSMIPIANPSTKPTRVPSTDT